MSATREELDQFHRFAINRLASGGLPVELDDLMLLWYDQQARVEINAVIRQGLLDIDDDKGRPAREVSEELCGKYGLTTE